MISIHAPREGCDVNAFHAAGAALNFNPRTPRGVRLLSTMFMMRDSLFQSTHPARGATASPHGLHPNHRISIHAPREGCDTLPHTIFLSPGNFNPRTPRGVRLGVTDNHLRCGEDFNPRTPRGVRPGGCRPRCRWAGDFNPRTPRGVRRLCLTSPFPSIYFNPRTPRGVRRRPRLATPATPSNFNPRTPRGVRHAIWLRGVPHQGISIHAPREGCDARRLLLVPALSRFQSTHPARGATANFTKEQRVCLAQFAYLHKGKKAEHTKTNAPMLH